MSITTVKAKNTTYALCAEPLEEFAQWCQGDLVHYEGRAIAVTLPEGSSDLAAWPGDILIAREGKLMRVQQDMIEGLIPEKVVTLLQKAHLIENQD